MVRLRRVLNENAAHAAFISLALVACSGGDSSSDPITPMAEEMSPETSGPSNGGGGVDPVNTETPAPLGETPSGEENPTDVTLNPPPDEGNGDGDGTATPTPPVEPPPVEPPPAVEPPPVEPPPVEPPPVQTPVFAEDTTEGCVIPALPNFDALPASNLLPDPFLKLDGTRVATRADWRCRRAEIKAMAERYIYGTKPPRPEVVSGTVTTNNITVNVQNQGQSATFGATITMPQGATGPVPAIIAFGGSSFQNTILQEGVAFINFNNNNVGNTTKQGAFYTANPGNQGVGNLIAWAWGVSRMIDVIEESGSQLIDPQAIGVTGCSRNGKGAFIAGAFDERVALTIPFEAGMAGVAAFRLVAQEAGAENPRNAISYEPWAGSVFEQFAPNEGTARQLQARLPVDTHEVVGLIAPRGLYIMGNPGIANLAPNSELVGALAGAEIYAALGVEENISYHSNTFNGEHCAFRAEHAPLLRQNISKFLKKDPNATTGEMNPDARLTQQLGPNINWQTPTLD